MKSHLSGMRARPYLLLICLAFVWGIHWPVAKIGLRDIPPFTYGALRVATGLAVMVGVLAARRGLRLPSRHDVPVVLSVFPWSLGIIPFKAVMARTKKTR